MNLLLKLNWKDSKGFRTLKNILEYKMLKNVNSFGCYCKVFTQAIKTFLKYIYGGHENTRKEAASIWIQKYRQIKIKNWIFLTETKAQRSEVLFPQEKYLNKYRNPYFHVNVYGSPLNSSQRSLNPQFNNGMINKYSVLCTLKFR